MTTAIVSPPMARKAATLVELLPTFSRGRSKRTGQPFYVVPASNRLTAHWTAVDGSGCTCLGYQRRGTCTHAIAARTRHERAAVQVAGAEHAPTSSPTSWRHCSQKCGALLAPEHATKMCDPCYERIARLLDIG